MIKGIPFISNLGKEEEEEKKKIDRLSKKKREKPKATVVSLKESIKKVIEYKYK